LNTLDNFIYISIIEEDGGYEELWKLGKGRVQNPKTERGF
jgi:hypothetical protein